MKVLGVSSPRDTVLSPSLIKASAKKELIATEEEELIEMFTDTGTQLTTHTAAGFPDEAPQCCQLQCDGSVSGLWLARPMVEDSLHRVIVNNVFHVPTFKKGGEKLILLLIPPFGHSSVSIHPIQREANYSPHREKRGQV